MPGYIIHLTEAKLILERLFAKEPCRAWSEEQKTQWSREFYCGTLLPDAVEQGQKLTSHFWSDRDAGWMFRTPNLMLFRERETLSLSNPILCGYYAHLHLDWVFFTAYLSKLIEWQDAEGSPVPGGKGAERVYLRNRNRTVSTSEFFSEQYLYGDYTKLNLALLGRYQLMLPEREQIPAGSCCGVALAGLHTVLQDLGKYLKRSQGAQGALKVFTVDSLTALLTEAAEQVTEELGKSDGIQDRENRQEGKSV